MKLRLSFILDYAGYHTNVENRYFSEHLWKTVSAYPVITCSKLTTETLEQGTKYVQS